MLYQQQPEVQSCWGSIIPERLPFDVAAVTCLNGVKTGLACMRFAGVVGRNRDTCDTMRDMLDVRVHCGEQRTIARKGYIT